MSVSRLANVANWDSLLTEIRNFLNATGDWTIHLNLTTPMTTPAAGGHELCASNGDCLVGLRSTDTGVGQNRFFIFDGIPPYSAPASLDTLPNNSGVRVSNYASASDQGRSFNPAWAGPFPTAFLFTNDPSTYCHVVVEVSAGKFRHMHFGNMRKFGTWTGGAYYTSQFWAQDATSIDTANSQDHTCPFDAQETTQARNTTFHYEGEAGLWRGQVAGALNGVTRRKGVGVCRGGFGHMFRNIQETQYSGLIALLPITLWAYNSTDAPDTIRCCGQVRDVADVNMRNLSPGESYMIGSDEWICFPLTSKSGSTADVENSGYYGLAYRVVP